MENLFSDANPMGKTMGLVLFYGVLFLIIYFLFIRPQNKKRKAEDSLRASVKIGDEIVTVGGIVGKVVSVREGSDTLVIETGTDKIKIKKWAIAKVITEE